VLTKKSKNNPILMESYNVLLGNVALDKEGSYVVVENSGISYGPADGATKLRTLGVTRVNRIYDSGRNRKKAIYDTEKIFRNIGRKIVFLSKENVYGCMIKTYIFYPVVLAFYENEEQRLQLSGYTARCLTARLAIHFAMRKFEKASAGFLVRAASEKKEGKTEEKQEKKEKRKKVREEVKARREQERLEKEAREINEAAEK